MVDKYLSKAVASVFRRGVKQQSYRCAIGGDSQYTLPSANEIAIIANRISDLLSVVRRLTDMTKWL
jgi:hypothetical protein